MRVDEFHTKMQRFDMDDVFEIPSKFVQDPNNANEFWPEAGCEGIDLFTMVNEVDLEPF